VVSSDYCRGPNLIPRHSARDLWSTKWYYNRIVFEQFRFLLSVFCSKKSHFSHLPSLLYLLSSSQYRWVKHDCLFSAVDSTRTSGTERYSCQFKTDIWSKYYLVWTAFRSRSGRISKWILFIPWPFVVWSRQLRAVPWFRWLGFGLSPRSSWFYPRPVHLSFMVDEVTIGEYFLWVLWFSLSAFFHRCPRTFIFLSQ